MNIMYTSNLSDGLFPTVWDPRSGKPINGAICAGMCMLGRGADGITTGQFSVGAFADSGYEYLLKQWLLSGRSETKAKDQCANSIL